MAELPRSSSLALIAAFHAQLTLIFSETLAQQASSFGPLALGLGFNHTCLADESLYC